VYDALTVRIRATSLGNLLAIIGNQAFSLSVGNNDHSIWFAPKKRDVAHKVKNARIVRKVI
ncbi:hypothetical protein, partial [Vibrio anguillarum]|uniref:hypothetical protein n=1 Tax=Vibrio anguillarum TaxID=55601 RepID=UPI001BDE5779